MGGNPMNDFISKNTYFTRSSGDLIMQINSEANKQKSKGKAVSFIYKY